MKNMISLAGSVGLLFLACLLSCSTSPIEESPVLHVNFESHDIGHYTSEMVRRDWGDVRWANLFDRAHIVQDPTGGGKVLRIAYPEGSVGPSEGGGQFLVSLPLSDELWFTYRMKFGEGFDFRLGGKLPGLTSGGGKYTGGTIPRDGDGWSARYMWRAGGKLGVYAYYVDMPGPWGQMMALDDAATIIPGQWHRIAQHIKLNTPGQSDGVLEVWFDGHRVLSRSNIRWRIGEQGEIDSLYFSTFHGGNTRDWAPRVDSFAYFNDFAITRNPPDLVLRP